MNDSTKDLEKLIKDLGKSGGGLSSIRVFLIKPFLVKLCQNILSD